MITERCYLSEGATEAELGKAGQLQRRPPVLVQRVLPRFPRQLGQEAAERLVGGQVGGRRGSRADKTITIS